jgi:hypothetical protein
MSDFKEIALRNAARGFRVIPLKGKDAFLTGWPVLATTDQGTIRAWAAKYPRANVGVCGGSDVIILDTDRLSRLQEICGINWAEWSKTYSVSSGRPDRAHFYFTATDEVLAFGNKRWKETGHDGNVFEIKAKGALIVAEGSIHPDTGGTYCITQDLPLIPFPSSLFAVLKDHWSRQNPSGKREWNLPVHDGEGRDDFLIQQAGRLRNIGASEAVIRAHLADLNADPNVMADPKSEADLDRIARSAARYDVPAPMPEIVFGTSRAAAKAPVDTAEKTPHPDYPDQVWDGTLYGEFAEIVCRDNFIPKKFASESFRILTGALVGDQLTCGIAGGRMRDYLAVIGLRQSGKSWAKDCAVWFYTKPSTQFLFEPLLFHGGTSRYRSLRIGAQQFLPGSPNSFVDELTREDRKKKPEKEPTIKVEITDRWDPMARFITIQGEAMSLFARFGNEWGGQALSALITDLYDGTETEVAVTSERGAAKVPVRVQYSMMLYTQPLVWRKYMAEHVMDSGLFGRFYIVGSEQKPTQVPLPDYEKNAQLFQSHFGDMRREMFARIEYLADHPLQMTISAEARRMIQNWLVTISDQDDGIDRASRMGLHVYRAAMARAWGGRKQRLEISAEDADAAILLGHYQIKQREYYAPVLGDDAKSKALNLVRQTIRNAGQITLRDLRRRVNSDRFSERFEWALEWLTKRRQIVVEAQGRGQLIRWARDIGD